MQTPTPEDVRLAELIINQKRSGSCSVIPYMLAHDLDELGKPYFDFRSAKKPSIFYGLCQSNRTGVTVDAPAGGTQDIIATRGSETIHIELAKPMAQREVLRRIGIEPPNELSSKALQAWAVAAYKVNGWDIRLEDPFAAALREAEEEHGIDLEPKGDYLGAPLVFESDILSKRSLEDAEYEAGAPMFTLDDVRTIEDLETLVAELGSMRSSSGRPRFATSHQTVYVVEVSSFDDTEVVDHHEIEGKIRARMGIPFHELGVFKTWPQMKHQLLHALGDEHGLAVNPGYDGLAKYEVLANVQRLAMLEGIEGFLVRGREENIMTVTERFRDYGPSDVLTHFRGGDTSSLRPPYLGWG